MVTRSMLSRVAYVVLALAPLCALARADVVHLKDGKKVEGKILKDTPAGIELETKFGKLMIERTKIDRIETKRLPPEEFKARLREAGNDENKLWEVAQYAKEQHLKDDYETALLRIVDANPKHKDAHEALGHVYFNGEWYPPDVAEREKAAYEKKMIESGKVFYDGTWMNPDSAKRLQGYEKYEGEWLLIPDIYKLKSAKLAPELLNCTFQTLESKHFQLRVPKDDGAGEELLKLLETQFDDFMAVFKPNPIETKILCEYPVVVYILPEAKLVAKFVEPGGYMEQIYNPPKELYERLATQEEFPIYFPRPLIVSSYGRHLTGRSSTTNLRGFLSMYLANVMIHRFTRNHRMPGWVDAGYSSYGEAKFNEFKTLTLIDEPDFVWEGGLESFGSWYSFMIKPENRASLTPIAQLRQKRKEELTMREIVKSYFMVMWLMQTKPDAFVDYARKAYEQFEITSKAFRAEETAFDEAFGIGPDEMDRQFEAWAQSIPPVPQLH